MQNFEKMEWSIFLRRCLLVSLVLHVAAAIFSYGFQNTDEHFQILEFLNFRLQLGPSDVSQLPIEYGRQLRHWLQPFLYAGPIQMLRALGVESPFLWAASARWVSALIGWASLVALAQLLPRWFAQIEERKRALLSLTFIWFMPALHARHSSESLSSTLIVGAVACVNPLLSGFLAGLAFTARYGVAFMVFGLGLWILVFAERRWRTFSIWSLGGALSVAVTVLIDRWGYGVWTYPAWNYFAFHAFEGNATIAGVSPWWDYFRRVWTETWPVLAPIVLFSSIASWFWFPRHVLTWVTLPFVVAHIFLGHKETRFLYPLAPLATLQCVLIYPKLKEALLGKPFVVVVRGVVALNFVALAALTLLPAWSPIRFFQGVYENALQIEQLYSFERDPYDVTGVRMNFYRPPSLRTERVTPEQLTSLSQVRPVWFAHNQRLPDGWEQNCSDVARSIPESLPQIGANNWTLYRCQAIQPPRVNR
jgi:phosphatidylinositol glycan class B